MVSHFSATQAIAWIVEESSTILQQSRLIMLRWRLTLGLLATLIILLTVGIYGVWLFNDLGRAVDKVLCNNYDSIRACHSMRVGTARVNIFYSRTIDRPTLPYDQTGPLDRTENDFKAAIPILERNTRDPEQKKLVSELKQATSDYIGVYREIFRQYFAHDPAIHDSWARIPELTLKITNLSETILGINEKQMLEANREARHKSADSIRLLLIAMVSSIIVFIFTYARLGRSLIHPIRRLTHSIRDLRSREFEHLLPVQSRDELGELTSEFNRMAQELRSFYRETDRKLIELNQIIRALLTTLPYPLFILDEHDRISRMNPAAESLMANLGAGTDLPHQVKRQLLGVSRGGTDYRMDDLKQALLFRIDEQETYFLPRIFPVILEDGTFSGRAVMLVDVTRFRWLDEVKTDLLATLSHEIKTPLTGIRLVLHLLLEQRTGKLSSSQEELVMTGCSECERLLKTLKSILDLARMESGQHQLDLAPISPTQVAQDAYDHFLEFFDQSSLHLELDIAPDLPDVSADSTRLSLVLTNFLSNALKYSFPGAQVEIRVQQLSEQFVRFSVTNRGPGLSDLEQAKVFDKFYRAEKQSVRDGVGLGLSIARQIVQAHDGRIGVKSEINGLTEFFCDLPVAVRVEQFAGV
jgi:NtrC-family two-component system sensor histidine kinase KinB